MLTPSTLCPPVADWFITLTEDTQGTITDMVNEQGYPLSDIREFIESYGERAFAEGYYETWCDIVDQLGIDNAAIEAYVDEVGIDNIEGFEDAYQGEYESEADFARLHFDAAYPGVETLEDAGVVIDWQGTWDANLSHTYSYNNGYVFNTNS